MIISDFDTRPEQLYVMQPVRASRAGSFLVDPDDTERATYKESRDGVRALSTPDWAQVFAYRPPGIGFAHALFDDLAGALGVENPFPGTCHPLTARRSGGTLRNAA